MSDNNKVPYSVHVHFHGTPTPEFLEAFNRMLDIASAAADSSILNGEIRESCEEFCQCKNPQQSTLTNGDVKCVLCGKLTWQNSLERT